MFLFVVKFEISNFLQFAITFSLSRLSHAILLTSCRFHQHVNARLFCQCFLPVIFASVFASVFCQTFWQYLLAVFLQDFSAKKMWWFLWQMPFGERRTDLANFGSQIWLKFWWWKWTAISPNYVQLFAWQTKFGKFNPYF